ncbi:MAG: helix-turn-helix transcriptional regulator [Alphaproteobacteria bacterium]|nr:helix-turn-helix transcriptional regulator [Alphaproteobacteria bacterium]
MITGRQIRAARGLLEWKAEDLAKRAGVARETISKIEADAVQPHEKTLANITRAFEDSGVEFLGDRGVSVKNDEVVTLKGENIYFRILDDVIASLRNKEDAEALFACVNDKVSPPAVVENYRRLRQTGIGMRSLVKEGDIYLMGQLEEYRYLPKKFFHNNATVIYGDKFATMILDPDTGADAGAVIIRNPHVAAAQRNLFNLIWSDAKKPEKTEAKIRYE